MPQPVTLGADKGYDVGDFVMELREKASPRMSLKIPTAAVRRSTAAPPATPAMLSPSAFAKRVEEAFGWTKTVAELRKMRHHGLPKVGWQFTLAMAAYNLVRLPKLLIQLAP
jgi:hypothetical protein